MTDQTRIECVDCGGTGKTTVRTSHGRAWKQNCRVCGGRKVRKPVFNVYNAANNGAQMMPKDAATIEAAESAVELFVAKGYDRAALSIKKR